MLSTAVPLLEITCAITVQPRRDKVLSSLANRVKYYHRDDKDTHSLVQGFGAMEEQAHIHAFDRHMLAALGDLQEVGKSRFDFVETWSIPHEMTTCSSHKKLGLVNILLRIQRVDKWRTSI